MFNDINDFWQLNSRPDFDLFRLFGASDITTVRRYIHRVSLKDKPVLNGP